MSVEYKFAVVQSASETGVFVQFEEDAEPSEKEYTRLQSCDCAPGDRVLMAPVSGSYIAIGVADRKSVINAETAGYAAEAGSANYATSANTANSANTAGSANTANSANTAGSANSAGKLTTKRTITLSGDVSGSGSFDGSANLTISVTVDRADVIKDQSNPSGRYIELRVVGSGLLQWRSSYYGSNRWYQVESVQV